jgi:hypothetical protein
MTCVRTNHLFWLRSQDLYTQVGNSKSPDNIKQILQDGWKNVRTNVNFLHTYFLILKLDENLRHLATHKKLRGLVRQRTIPPERPPLVGEVSANFSG